MRPSRLSFNISSSGAEKLKICSRILCDVSPLPVLVSTVFILICPWTPTVRLIKRERKKKHAMKSLPGFAEEAYVHALNNKVFFSVDDIALVYRSDKYGYVSFFLVSGHEVRVYDDGTIKMWEPGIDNGIVLVQGKQQVRAGEL